MKNTKPTIKCNVRGSFTVTMNNYVFTVFTLKDAMFKIKRLLCPIFSNKVDQSVKKSATLSTVRHFLNSRPFLCSSSEFQARRSEKSNRFIIISQELQLI